MMTGLLMLAATMAGPDGAARPGPTTARTDEGFVLAAGDLVAFRARPEHRKPGVTRVNGCVARYEDYKELDAWMSRRDLRPFSGANTHLPSGAPILGVADGTTALVLEVRPAGGEYNDTDCLCVQPRTGPYRGMRLWTGAHNMVTLDEYRAEKLLETGRMLERRRLPVPAARSYRRCEEEYPGTRAAGAARERLAAGQ